MDKLSEIIELLNQQNLKIDITYMNNLLYGVILQ